MANAKYNRKDKFYEQAKADGYRSRAAYKLLELQKRHKLMWGGASVLDLGAWPGGWLQAARKIVGAKGKVVGIDLVAVDPLPFDNVHLITNDACEESAISEAKEYVGGKFNVVISDMSQKLTGIKEADRVGSVGCGELAFWVAQQYLQARDDGKGGNFTCKLFKSAEADQFVNSIRSCFSEVKRVHLDSTRKSSNEFYFVGKGFKG